MSDFIYRWLLAAPRPGLATIAVAAFCVSVALLPNSTAISTAAVSAFTATPDPDTTAAASAADWPRTALRLWFLLPQLHL